MKSPIFDSFFNSFSIKNWIGKWNENWPKILTMSIPISCLCKHRNLMPDAQEKFKVEEQVISSPHPHELWLGSILLTSHFVGFASVIQFVCNLSLVCFCVMPPDSVYIQLGTLFILGKAGWGIDRGRQSEGWSFDWHYHLSPLEKNNVKWPLEVKCNTAAGSIQSTLMPAVLRHSLNFNAVDGLGE